MNILGISAYYHDSATCLLQDGKIIAAAQEERYTRIKHDSNFPINAIKSCLEIGSINVSDLDYIVFYDKPFLKFERILETYVDYAPVGFKSFLKAIPVWLKKKLWIKFLIMEELEYNGKVLFAEHHESHAGSAFYSSPFDEAAFLTMDGVGEWATTSYGIGKQNNIDIISDIQFPHSLGLLYSAFTYFTGFKVSCNTTSCFSINNYNIKHLMPGIHCNCSFINLST